MNRFLDEVWMTSALKHKNVVEVAGFGRDDEGPFIAIELVQGVSLARLRKTVFETGEEFSERLVVYIGVCIARGLSAAHTLTAVDGEPLGLVHRDLNLDNVLVGFDGDVKIADFGFATAKQRITSQTVGFQARPTLQLAPEEVTGKTVDHRLDLFSLGQILYELLAKKPAWSGKTEMETLVAITNEAAPSLSSVRPRMDKSVAALVMRCLEKDPAARYPDAASVADALDQWLDKHGWPRGNAEALSRFVRRNSMRQMRWFEQALAGTPAKGEPSKEVPAPPSSPPVTREKSKESRTAVTAVERPSRDRASPAPPEPSTKPPRSPRHPTAQLEALGEVVAARPPTISISKVIPEEDDDPDWDAATLVQARPTPLPEEAPAADDDEGLDLVEEAPTQPSRPKKKPADLLASIEGELDAARSEADAHRDLALELSARAERAHMAARLAREAALALEEARALAQKGDRSGAERKVAIARELLSSVESDKESLSAN